QRPTTDRTQKVCKEATSQPRRKQHWGTRCGRSHRTKARDSALSGTPTDILTSMQIQRVTGIAVPKIALHLICTAGDNGARKPVLRTPLATKKTMCVGIGRNSAAGFHFRAFGIA